MQATTLRISDTALILAEAQHLSRRFRRQGRRCLMCDDTFGSEWVGNRVCKRCKKSSAWRSQ